MMELTYLGTNTLLIKKPGSMIMVDPHFTRPGLPRLLAKISPDPHAIAAGLSQHGIDQLDGVLLTHTHYDHALDAVEVLRQAGGVLYGFKSAHNLVKSAGLEEPLCIQVAPGSVYPVGAFQVIFHPSQHLPFPAPFKWLLPQGAKIAHPLSPPTWFWRYQCGSVSALQVDRTLIFGSAGFLPGAFRNFEIEAVVLSVGGLDGKPISYLRQHYHETVVLPGAKHVYLSHWDNFFQPAGKRLNPHFLSRRSITRIRLLGKIHGQSVHLLNYGETISI
jgi:hypothetical protein